MTLDEWLTETGVPHRDLAARVGVSESMVSHLRHGRSRPSLSLALVIERETGGAVSPRELLVERKQGAVA